MLRNIIIRLKARITCRVKGHEWDYYYAPHIMPPRKGFRAVKGQLEAKACKRCGGQSSEGRFIPDKTR